MDWQSCPLVFGSCKITLLILFVTVSVCRSRLPCQRGAVPVARPHPRRGLRGGAPALPVRHKIYEVPTGRRELTWDHPNISLR